MVSTTRQVLNYFDTSNEAVSLTHLAKDLQITQGILEGILTYWVRKGELREIVADEAVCQSCNIKNGCPFVTALPRYYVRNTTTRPEHGSCCQGSCITDP